MNETTLMIDLAGELREISGETYLGFGMRKEDHAEKVKLGDQPLDLVAPLIYAQLPKVLKQRFRALAQFSATIMVKGLRTFNSP